MGSGSCVVGSHDRMACLEQSTMDLKGRDILQIVE